MLVVFYYIPDIFFSTGMLLGTVGGFLSVSEIINTDAECLSLSSTLV